MKKIITNTTLDIEDIQDQTVYLNCLLTQKTNDKFLGVRNVYFIDCEFKYIFKQIVTDNVYIINTRFVNSHVIIFGHNYYSNKNSNIYRTYLQRRINGR